MAADGQVTQWARASAAESINETPRWSQWLLCVCWLPLWLSLLKLEVQPVEEDDRSDCLFHFRNSDSTGGNLWHCFCPWPFCNSTYIIMFTVLDPLLKFIFHLLSSQQKSAFCIHSLLWTLFLFRWHLCQQSHITLMEVSQCAYNMIHYISVTYGYFYICEIYVNLIWCLYLFIYLCWINFVWVGVGVRAVVLALISSALSTSRLTLWGWMIFICASKTLYHCFR